MVTVSQFLGTPLGLAEVFQRRSRSLQPKLVPKLSLTRLTTLPVVNLAVYRREEPEVVKVSVPKQVHLPSR